MIEKQDLINMINEAAKAFDDKPQFQLAISLLIAYVDVANPEHFKGEIQAIFSREDSLVEDCRVALIDTVKKTSMQPWDFQNLERVMKIFSDAAQVKMAEMQDAIFSNNQAAMQTRLKSLQVLQSITTFVLGIVCQKYRDFANSMIALG